jgi:hypothetical protein
MFELSGTIKDLSIDFLSGKAVLNLSVNEKQSAMACFDELRSCEKLSIKIGKYREKRSNDANAYCWVLIGKLAEKLNIPRDEIYRNAIKQVGGNYEIVCVQDKAVEKLCSGWRGNGIGWQTDTMPSKIDGCTNVVLYYGSSTYDTASMSRLINIIVDECKDQNIDTRTPDKIASMLALWGEKDG